MKEGVIMKKVMMAAMKKKQKKNIDTVKFTVLSLLHIYEYLIL
jgi:hypothetical protein